MSEITLPIHLIEHPDGTAAYVRQGPDADKTITLPELPGTELCRLIQLCKASVSIEVNKHRDYYETVAQYLEERDIEGTDPEVIAKMIELDTVIELQFYPRTPIGFHLIWHYDIGLALEQALATFEEPEKK